MRTLIITLVIAFVFLLTQHLNAAHAGRDWEERENSQAVVTGLIGCHPEEALNRVFISVETGLGVNSISEGGFLAEAVDLSEECSDLIPRIAEKVPHRICEVGEAREARDPGVEAIRFVCTRGADAVISAVGKMAKTVIRLAQP